MVDSVGFQVGDQGVGYGTASESVVDAVEAVFLDVFFELFLPTFASDEDVGGAFFFEDLGLFLPSDNVQ